MDRADAPRPRAQHHDAVGQRDRFAEIVGHEHHAHAAVLRQTLELIEHQELELGIKRAERFIHQQRFGLIDQRARHRGALAHAARKLRRCVVLEPLETDQLDHLPDPILRLGARRCVGFQLQSDSNVVLGGAPRQQCVLLRHVADAPVRPGDRIAVIEHLARGRPHQAGDHVEDRRLAAAARTHERDELMRADIEIGRMQRLDVLAADLKGLLGAQQADFGRCSCIGCARGRHVVHIIPPPDANSGSGAPYEAPPRSAAARASSGSAGPRKARSCRSALRHG